MSKPYITLWIIASVLRVNEGKQQELGSLNVRIWSNTSTANEQHRIEHPRVRFLLIGPNMLRNYVSKQLHNTGSTTASDRRRLERAEPKELLVPFNSRLGLPHRMRRPSPAVTRQTVVRATTFGDCLPIQFFRVLLLPPGRADRTRTSRPS